jgi:hypothetical protein
MRAVVEHQHAPVGKPSAGAVSSGEHGPLGADLRQQRAGRKRRRLHDAGERRAPGRGIEQVVRRAPARVEPAAPADAARRDARSRETKRVQGAFLEGALYVDCARLLSSPAHDQVPGAVDGEARVQRECACEHVGKQPLREAAAVELHAARTRYGAPLAVDPHVAPAGDGRRRCRTALWCTLERERQRQRLPQIARVPRFLDLIEERAVHESAAECAGVDHRLREAGHQRAHRHRFPRVGVEARQLAVGDEAREAHVPLLELLPREAGGRAGDVLLGRADEHRAPRAEAREALGDLADAHHDCFVVTADEAPLAPLLEEVPEEEEDSPLPEEPPEEDDSPLPEEDDDDSPRPEELVELEEPDSPPPELEELDSPLVAELVVLVLGAAEELCARALLDLPLEALAFVPAPLAVALRLAAALSAGS